MWTRHDFGEGAQRLDCREIVIKVQQGVDSIARFAHRVSSCSSGSGAEPKTAGLLGRFVQYCTSVNCTDSLE